VAAGLLGVLVGLPLIFAILGDADPMRIWRTAGAEFLLQLVPAAAVGVWLGPKVGLGPRLLRDLVVRTPGRLKSALVMLVPSVVIGALLGLPLLLGAGPEQVGPRPAALFLRALSAALTEEIEFRLGLMTLFAWLLHSFVSRSGSAERSIQHRRRDRDGVALRALRPARGHARSCRRRLGASDSICFLIAHRYRTDIGTWKRLDSPSGPPDHAGSLRAFRAVRRSWPDSA
jgi:hypothetical protein